MGRLAIWGFVCLLVGGAFAANALWIYGARRKFLHSAARAVGTVVEVQVRGLGRNAVSVPVFEFTTGTGSRTRAKSLVGSGLQRFAVGESVGVWYDPVNPERAEVDTFAVLWGLPLLRAGFGGLFAVMGTVGLLVSQF